MNEDPGGISRRENATDESPSENRRREAPLVNHRAERGGDPGGISPGENPEGRSPEGEPTGRRSVGDHQAEGRVVNPKGGSQRENQRGEALVVNRQADLAENQRSEALVVNARTIVRARTTEESEVVKWEALLIGAGCGGPVIAHARAVALLSLQFAGSPVVNRDLVEAGAMLHDIGRGMTHGIDHAQRGAALARSLRLDPSIVSIIERHIGAGMTADECSLEGLVPRDCMPVTVEEKIVANADNLVNGEHPGTIEGSLGGAIRLRRRIRRRIYRLYMEMECIR